MQHSIETGNVVLILIGLILIVSGPIIVYRTTIDILRRRKRDSKAKIHYFSTFINYLIAVLFLLAGILFVINNLKGNPLAETSLHENKRLNFKS